MTAGPEEPQGSSQAIAGASAEATAVPSAKTVAASERDLKVDALKCLAILLVIATHILSLRREFQQVAPSLVTWIVAFDMPLFAALSGWVLAGREGDHPGRFLRRKVLTLYVPYFAWIAVEAPLRRVTVAGVPFRLWQALVSPHAGMQMWFLAVLFWMFVVFTLTRLVSRSDIWTGAVALAVGAVGLFPRLTIMGVDKIAWLYPFFVLGYLLARNRGELHKLVSVGWAAAAAMAALAVLGHAALAGSYLAALALSGAVAAVYFVLPHAILAAQAWLGRRTLGVYGAQMVVLPFLIVGSGWIGAISSWTLVAVAATLVAFALEHVPVARAVFLARWPRGPRPAAPGPEREPDPV